MTTWKTEGLAGALILTALIAGCGGGDSEPMDEAPVAETSAANADTPGCPSDETIEAYLTDWRAAQPTRATLPADAAMEDAMCAQGKIVARLQGELGPVVGYKAGLTSPPAQERFGATAPVRGVLLRDMLLPNGAEVAVSYGARPMFEADLIVVVGDGGINTATTPEEVLAHLSQVIPFIELPDLAVAETEPLNATILAANNVAARLGVMGDPIAVENTPAFLQALADMSVRVTDQTGAELAAAQGSAVLGHPLNAVLWLIQDGVRLQEGQFVSVGSIGPLMPARAGTTVSVSYAGLPGDPTVTVDLR